MGVGGVGTPGVGRRVCGGVYRRRQPEGSLPEGQRVAFGRPHRLPARARRPAASASAEAGHATTTLPIREFIRTGRPL
jgi:hypothetical protein